MRLAITSFVALAILTPVSAGAQEATPSLQRSGGASTESQLAQLAGLLGTMQMIQALCSPRDGDFWRDRMQEMIRLEKPSREQQNALIGAFNAGYNNAQNKFTTCTVEARSLATDSAKKGEALAQTLSNAISLPPSQG